MSRREFQFIEGASKKFWAIELSGSSFTVQWGRIGTQGQTQTKEFSSDAEANKQYTKLIAEKTNKGYVEIGASAAVANVPAAMAGAVAAKAVRKKAEPVTAATSAVEAAPAAPVTPTPVTSVNLEITSTIDLAPADWHTAVWRPRQAMPRPQSQPFDLEQCTSRVARVSVGTYGWQWDWSTASIPVVMTPEEAHFWLSAMTSAHRKVKPKELAAELAKRQYKKLTGADALQMLKKKLTSVTREVLLPLSNLVSIEELMDMLAATPAKRAITYAESPWNDDPEMILGFQQYILPYLTDAELQRIRKAAAGKLDPTHWPTSHHEKPAAWYYLAALVGMPNELLRVVQGWKEDLYGRTDWDCTAYQQPQIIVLGLGSPQLVESEMRRHKLPLNKPEYIRGWLATTEYAALDYVRDCILEVTNKEVCEKLLRVFALVKAPQAAAHMLELKLSSKAPKLAREWLETNLGCAVAGLVPVAGGRGKLADAAIEFLRDVKRAGHAELIRHAAGDNLPERVRQDVLERVEKVYQPLDASTTPPWLVALPTDLKAKGPGWLDTRTLPPLVVGEHRLNDEHIRAVLMLLQKSSLESPLPVLTSLRENATAESRDAFAWRLFEAWLAEGAPSKEKWAMGAIGHLGSDGCALRITPLIRNWPGESQHQRAVFGLECLRAIGSDTALMQLNGIAQKLKFKGLKNKAMEFMEAIAAHRNMSRSELEDRIVPDCELDEKGTRIFDFGPRQFRFVLGPDMKAMIKDTDGKVRGDLPAPGSKDDPAKSKEAVEAWKLLKKQIREVAKIQAERLEQAMVTGRRWKVEEFQALLVKHPLMINVVRLVVWGGYDDKGKLTTTFRVTEDQTFADSADEEMDLDGVACVGIVHPLHLSSEQKNAWGEILSDYEIVPPFQQIGRPVYALEKGEENATEITRFKDVKIPATALVGTLERLAWVRGIPEDAGIFYEHSKPFPGANVTAFVQYSDGVPVGYMEGWDDQKLTSCFILPGIYKPTIYPDHKQTLKLSKVDPVVISEVLKDLILIASKGK